MIRIVLEPEERRREIVEAAMRLFGEKGYAATTVNDIIDAVGIAKGTFYHHFASKGEVMRAVVDHVVDDGIERAKQIAADASLGHIDRILAIVAAQNVQAEAADMLDALHEPGNAEFHLLSHTAMIERLTPIMAGVVCEGIAAGVFDTPFPDEAVAMLLSAAALLTDDGFQIAGFDDRERMIAAILTGAERLFGTAPGAITDRAAAFLGGASS